MAGERSFIVKILGNADGAITAFKKLGREGKDTLDGISETGKKIGDGFNFVKAGVLAAVGAITAVGTELFFAAKAAAADEKSQKLLADQLEKSTGATIAQVQGIENFIEKAMMATGIADDELRPAFANLARATGDMDQSQRLFNLALDISAATGRDLEAVTTALGRAANGQVTALQRLGIPLDDNIKKSKDFSGALKLLEGQFGGAAATAADTFEGRLRILKTSFGEVQEEIGYYLLPLFEKIVNVLQTRVVPAIRGAVDAFGEKGLRGALIVFAATLGPIAQQFLNFIESMARGAITGMLKIMKAFFFVDVIATTLIGTMKVLKGDFSGTESVGSRLQVAMADLSAELGGLRNEITNTGVALNLQGNSLNRWIDQTDSLGTKVLPRAKESFDDLVPKIEKAGGGLDKAAEAAKKKEAAVKELSQALEKEMAEALKNAQANLEDARDKFDEFAESVSDTIKAAVNFGDAMKLADESGDYGFGSALDQQAEQASEFADTIKKLVAAGLSEPALRQVLDAGVQAGTAIGKKLLESADNILKANKIVQTLNNIAKTVGDSAAEAFYGAGVKDGEAYLKGVEAAIAAAQSRLAGAKNKADVKGAAAVFADMRPALTTPTAVPAVPAAGTQVNVVVNTGVGTNGAEAGRQIAELLQQYQNLNPNGSMADFYRQAQVGVLR